MTKHNMSVTERFWTNVNKTEDDDCWLWKKYVLNSGYGLYSISHSEHILAHRMAWIATHGDISEGLEVAHRCSNKLCVNPGHLYLATHDQNMKEIFIRNLINKSSDGRIFCPKCNREIDDNYKSLLTNMARTES